MSDFIYLFRNLNYLVHSGEDRSADPVFLGSKCRFNFAVCFCSSFMQKSQLFSTFRRGLISQSSLPWVEVWVQFLQCVFVLHLFRSLNYLAHSGEDRSAEPAFLGTKCGFNFCSVSVVHLFSNLNYLAH